MKNIIPIDWDGIAFSKLKKLSDKNKIDLNSFIFQLQSHKFQKDFSKHTLPEGLLEQVKGYLKEEHPSLVKAALGDQEVKRKLSNILSQYINEKKITTQYKTSLGELTHRQLVDLLVEDVAGFGPIDELFAIPTLTDIHINRLDNIWIDDYENGPKKVDIQFKDMKEYEKLLAKIMNAAGVSYSYSHPQASGALPNFRFDIVGHDLSDCPTCSIRILSKELRITEETIVSSGQVDKNMLMFMKELMLSKISFTVSGETGSGKTELMRFLCGYIHDLIRIISIEDVKEMMLEILYPDRNIASWITRFQLGSDNKIEWNLATLCKVSLRHNPAVIALGETRDYELYHLVKQGETDHRIITGIHASKGKVVKRMTSILDEYLPNSKGHREKVVEVFPINFHLERVGEKSVRTVTQIAEYQNSEDGDIKENVLFKYDYHLKRHVQVGTLSEELVERLKESPLVNLDNIKFLLPTLIGGEAV